MCSHFYNVQTNPSQIFIAQIYTSQFFVYIKYFFHEQTFRYKRREGVGGCKCYFDLKCSEDIQISVYFLFFYLYDVES